MIYMKAKLNHTIFEFFILIQEALNILNILGTIQKVLKTFFIGL